MLLSCPAPGTTGTEILVVGGDGETSGVYCSLLRAGGWRVESMPDAQRVLALGTPRPQLVLLCGWEAVESFVAAMPELIGAADTVVVAHCAYVPEAIAQALDRGVDAFIPQPCSAPVLVRRLRAALRWTAAQGGRVLALRDLAP
jgi:CheY-like chemotaxis protein